MRSSETHSRLSLCTDSTQVSSYYDNTVISLCYYNNKNDSNLIWNAPFSNFWYLLPRIISAMKNLIISPNNLCNKKCDNFTNVWIWLNIVRINVLLQKELFNAFHWHCSLFDRKHKNNTHTYLMAFFLGLPTSASIKNVKPIWILLKQETVSGSGISWTICKSAPRSKQITTQAPHQSVFYRLDALPAAQPTASKHWRHYLFCSHYLLNIWPDNNTTCYNASFACILNTLYLSNRPWLYNVSS